MSERARLCAVRLALVPLVAAGLLLDGYRVRLELAGLATHHAPLLGVALTLVLVCAATPLAALLATALVWRARRGTDFSLLALFLGLVAYLLSNDGFWLWAARAHPPAWLSFAVDAADVALGFAAVAVLLRFSAVFPQRLMPEHLGRAGAPARGVLRGTRAALLRRPATIWLVAAAVYAFVFVPNAAVGGLPRPPAWYPAFHALGKIVVVAFFIAGLAAGVANLRTGARLADPAGRRRLFWLLWGFLAGVAIIIIGATLQLAHMVLAFQPLGYALGTALYLAFLVILVGLTIAMFFSGALDPALALRRTAVFGMVGITLVFVFAAVEKSMEQLVVERLGLSDHLTGFISGGLVALTFDRVKERFNRVVERWSGRVDNGPAHEVQATPADAGDTAARDVAYPPHP